MSHATVSHRPPTRTALPWHVRAVAIGSGDSYRFLTTMTALALVLAAATGFGWDRHDLPLAIAALAFLALLAMAIRAVGAGRLATAIEAPVLLLAATMAAACLSLLLAATALPYRDGLLDAADRLILPMVRWRDMYLAAQRHPMLFALMGRVYQTLLWQPFVLAPLLALVDEPLCWRFVRAWFATLIACVAIFPFVPAIGPYLHNGLSVEGLSALGLNTGTRPVEVLDAVRSGALRDIAPPGMTGLISFPSFHAASATLMFWAFRRVPVIGRPFMALNVAMVLTAPLIGSHYFVDIPAGIAVALLAIRATRDAPRPPRAHG